MMRRNAMLWLALGMVLCTAAACRREKPATTDTRFDLTFSPTPPVVGEVDLSLVLADSAGRPLSGASVQVEGNMNHAGMKPTFSTLAETDPGHYKGALDFTMGGDWFVLVTATFPDGRRLERKIDVPGVRTP